MLLVYSAIECPRTVRRCLSSVQSPPALVGLLLLQLGFPADAYAATETPALIRGASWIVIAGTFVLIGIVAVVSHTRMKAAQRQVARAQELAEHRKYERNWRNRSFCAASNKSANWPRRRCSSSRNSLHLRSMHRWRNWLWAQPTRSTIHCWESSRTSSWSGRTPVKNSARRSSSASREQNAFRLRCGVCWTLPVPGRLS